MCITIKSVHYKLCIITQGVHYYTVCALLYKLYIIQCVYYYIEYALLYRVCIIIQCAILYRVCIIIECALLYRMCIIIQNVHYKGCALLYMVCIISCDYTGCALLHRMPITLKLHALHLLVSPSTPLQPTLRHYMTHTSFIVPNVFVHRIFI